MGVLGWATLEEVDDEIAIQPGPGAVVTGTFAHISDAVIDLQIEGQPKPIGCTTTHPFWSVDRQDFVEAGRLQQGERVQLYSGETKRIVQKLPRPGPVNVYNLEVYAEHVYCVTPDGVLTHNECKNHEHHIVMKGAFTHWTKSRKFVIQAQNILTKYEICIRTDKANLVKGVPNRGHSVRYAKIILEHLQDVVDDTQSLEINQSAIRTRLEALKKYMLAENGGSLKAVPCVKDFKILEQQKR